MSRLRADLLLLLTAAIWGTAFIAQKTGMEGLGPFTFVAARFVLSFFIILPLAYFETRKPLPAEARGKPLGLWLAALALVFFAGVALQQVGLLTTSVTNAGFLTGLYVVMVPLIGWALTRIMPARKVAIACAMAVAGTFLLNDASLEKFSKGDWVVLAGAFFFALQVVIIGFLSRITQRPLFLVAVQYASCAVLGLACAAMYESVSVDALLVNIWPILYAGVVSGGIAYTLQAVAQQYTPSSDAAIIMSAEAPFAALAGYMLLNERLSVMGWSGCALILLAILIVELRGIAFKRRAG